MDLPQSTPASHQGYHPFAGLPARGSFCQTCTPCPPHCTPCPSHHTICAQIPHTRALKQEEKELLRGIPRSRFSVLLDVRQFWHKQPVPPSQLCFPARSREAAAFRDFTPDLSPWDRGSAATPCRGPGGRGPGATSAVTL